MQHKKICFSALIALYINFTLGSKIVLLRENNYEQYKRLYNTTAKLLAIMILNGDLPIPYKTAKLYDSVENDIDHFDEDESYDKVSEDYMQPDSDDRIDHDYAGLDPVEDDESSRAILRRSCNKKAIKKCKKACKNAVRITCSDYDCSRGFKGRLKKSCKKKCKEEFE